LAVQKENSRLQQELGHLQDGRKVDGKTFSSIIKNLAFDTAGDDEHFLTMLQETGLTQQFPMMILPQLEHALRDALQVGQERVTLFDMIAQARDSELLSDEAIDMAHLLRKQGNIVKHGRPEQRTLLARGLITLYAAAILWPELSAAIKRPRPIPMASGMVPD
jgi:hypothetical protein